MALFSEIFVGARVYNNANISVADSTGQVLTFNAERYDTDSIHSTSSNTSRLTCNTAGKYLIVANIAFDDSAAGGIRTLSFILNNTDYIAAIDEYGMPAGKDTRLCLTTVYDLAVSDYVEVTAYQNTGGALNVLYGAKYSPEFMMHRIG